MIAADAGPRRCRMIRVSADSAALAAEFDLHRSRLVGIGYRLTGEV